MLGRPQTTGVGGRSITLHHRDHNPAFDEPITLGRSLSIALVIGGVVSLPLTATAE